MAVDTVLQVRMDKKTKDDVENLYRTMGLTFASKMVPRKWTFKRTLRTL